jgi:hypothetical protein
MDRASQFLGSGVRTRMMLSTPLPQGGLVIKTIVLAFITLCVPAGIANSVSGLDAKTFYEQQDRTQH